MLVAVQSQIHFLPTSSGLLFKMNTTNDTLYAFLRDEKQSHQARFTSVEGYRFYCTKIYNRLSSDFTECALSASDFETLIKEVCEWLNSLGPETGTKQVTKVVDDVEKTETVPTYFHFKMNVELLNRIVGWEKIVTDNKSVQDALAGLDCSDDPALTPDRVKPLLWYFLYLANYADLGRSVRSLCQWLLQCKGNLSGTNHHHHPLLYISRDKSDGSKEGGNGKSFISIALAEELAARGLPATPEDLPSSNSEFVSDAFSKNWLICLNEIKSVHRVNETAIKTIFEDPSYMVHRKFKEPYSVPVTSMLIGSTNELDWFATDSSLADRLNIINVNAELQLRDNRILSEVNSIHPLPSKKDIADAFLQLLRVPEETYRGIIGECGNDDGDIETDTDWYRLSEMLVAIRKTGVDMKMCPTMLLKEEINRFENGSRKWKLNQASVNRILNTHFGNNGVKYFHGKHLHDKLDLTGLLVFDVPGLATRPNEIEAYRNVWEWLHPASCPKYPTDPDDFDPETIRRNHSNPDDAETTVDSSESTVDSSDETETCRLAGSNPADGVGPMAAESADPGRPMPPDTAVEDASAKSSILVQPSPRLFAAEPRTAKDVQSPEVAKHGDIPQSNVAFYDKTTKPVWNPPSDASYQFESLNPIDPDKAKADIEAGNSSTGCRDDTVASMRNFLFEFDDLDDRVQRFHTPREKLLDGDRVYLMSKTIVNRLVFSGSKSFHARVTIDYEPLDTDEYKRIWHYINDTFFEGRADEACSNPSRKTRRPNGFRLDTDKNQTLEKESDFVFELSKSPAVLEKLYHVDEDKKFLREFAVHRNGGRKGSGTRADAPAVRYFLDTPFPQGVKHGGDAHHSFYCAILSCLGGEDRGTLDRVVAKARFEGWNQREINGSIRDAEQHLSTMA